MSVYFSSVQFSYVVLYSLLNNLVLMMMIDDDNSYRND